MGVHLKDVSQSFWTAPLNHMKKWKFPSIQKHPERPQQPHSSRYSFRNDKHWSLFILAACALRCGSHNLCTYSTAGGHLGSFCFLAIVVSATKNVILTIFWLLLAWFLLGSCLYSALVRMPCPKVIISIHTPASRVWNIPFLKPQNFLSLEILQFGVYCYSFVV